MEFFKNFSPTEAAYRQVQMGIEQIRAGIHRLSRHEEEVTEWLQQHVQIWRSLFKQKISFASY